MMDAEAVPAGASVPLSGGTSTKNTASTVRKSSKEKSEKKEKKEKKIYEKTGLFDMGGIAEKFHKMKEDENKWGAEEEIAIEEIEVEMDELDEDHHERRIRRMQVLQREEKIARKGVQMSDESRFRMLMSEEDLDLMEKEARESELQARWAKFDLFFGMLVAANGVLMGVTTDYVSEDEAWPRLAESVFLVLFIIEFGVRAKLRPGTFMKFLCNPWALFDAIIISISVIDNWILAAIGSSGGASVVAVLRVFRLMRLVRLVRLLKLLKELWLLVSGMMESMRILFWAVVMLTMVIYIVALFMQTMVSCPKCKWADDPHVQQYWGSIPRTMLTLLQIATYDGWGDLVRYLLVGPPGTKGEGQPYLFLVFWAFTMISSLGILNLIIGVLLVSALEVTKRDGQYEENANRTKRHEALLDLRQVMRQRAEEEGLEHDDRGYHVHRNDVFRWKTEYRQVQMIHRQESKSSLEKKVSENKGDDGRGSVFQGDVSEELKELTLEDVDLGVGHLLVYADLTDDEIHSVFDEISSVSNSKHHHITVDDFIEGCMWLKGQVHALDVLHVMAGLRSMQNRLNKLTRHLDKALHALDNTEIRLDPLLHNFHRPEKAKHHHHHHHHHHDDHHEEEEEQNAGGEHEEFNHIAAARQAQIAAQEKELMQAEAQKLAQDQMVGRFDGFFGIFVMLNGVSMGMQATREQKGKTNIFLDAANPEDIIWYGVEQVFWFIFVIELIMRAIMHYQIFVEGELGVVWRIFPMMAWELDYQRFCGVLTISVPKLFKDPIVLFDLSIILIQFVDLWILYFVGGDSGASVLSILRLFRLFRLLRLVRLLHLLRPLWLLCEGLKNTTSLLFWALVMLFTVTYMGGIFMVEIVGKSDKIAPEHHKTEHPLLVMEKGVYTGASLFFDGIDDDCTTKELYDNWRNLPSSMFAMLQVASMENWSRLAKCANDFMPGITVFFILFLILTGLGILNLVVGVMVQAAFTIVRGENERTAADDLQKCEMVLKERCYHLFVIEAEYQKKREEAAAAAAARKTMRQQEYEQMAESYEAEGGRRSQLANGNDEEEHEERILTPRKNAPVDPGVLDKSLAKVMIHLDQMAMLINDEIAMKALDSVGLRIDHLLMVFQKIDVTGKSEVLLSAFLEGLVLFKMKVRGIDVACAKSWMRRLVLEGYALRQEGLQCHRCFKAIVEKLRGVQVTDTSVQDRFSKVQVSEVEQIKQEEEAHFLTSRQVRLQEENRRLGMKCSRMKAHIAERQKLLQAIREGHDPETQSLNSAGTGAD